MACFLDPFADTLVPPKAVKACINRPIKYALSCLASRNTSGECLCEPHARCFATGRDIRSCIGIYLCKIEVLELPDLKLKNVVVKYFCFCGLFAH